MKIDSIGETVEGTITALQTEGFKIANTAHMMEILSKRLYSNPELAVCRELVCNALDAHVAAGNKQPVEITLPDWTNDFRFIVKDFGTGLSEEAVMNLYTTYGASTKQSSNDFIGCLGIGSKSPFAVTEEFSVVSRYQGIATTYHCYKQKGMPVCTKLSEVATDEHNGMTITVPFKENSCGSFNSYAKEFFKGVNKELVKVSSTIPLEFFEDCTFEVQYKAKSLPYGVYVREEYYGDNYVRMGQVLYKIPSQWVRDSSMCSNYKSTLDAPIGTFTIAASRENIEENDTNKQKYLSIIESLKTEFYKEYLKPALDKARTYYTYASLRSFNNLFDFSEEVNKAYEHVNICTDNCVGYVKSWSKQKCNRSWRYREDVYAQRDCENYAIIPDEEPVVAYGILLKNWYGNSSKDISYVLLPKDRHQHLTKRIVSYYSFKNVVYTSQLNEWHLYLKKQDKRRSKTAKRKVKAEGFRVYTFGNNYQVRYQKNSTALGNYEKPYVVLKDFECVDTEDPARIEKMYQYDDDCFGVSSVNVKYLTPDWIPLKDYLEKYKDDFEERDYNKRRKECIRCLRNSQSERKYVSNSLKEFLGKNVWLSRFDGMFADYTPKTLGDRLALALKEKHERYKKFLTGVEGWFIMYSYPQAPEEVKTYVNKLFKDIVESSESSTETNKTKG